MITRTKIFQANIHWANRQSPAINKITTLTRFDRIVSIYWLIAKIKVIDINFHPSCALNDALPRRSFACANGSDIPGTPTTALKPLSRTFHLQTASHHPNRSSLLLTSFIKGRMVSCVLRSHSWKDNETCPLTRVCPQNTNRSISFEWKPYLSAWQTEASLAKSLIYQNQPGYAHGNAKPAISHHKNAVAFNIPVTAIIDNNW